MLGPSPYEPPRGAIAPAATTQYGEIRPFSTRGRLGRVRYIGYSVGLGLLINLLFAGWAGVMAAFAAGQAKELFALGGFALLALATLTLSVVLAIQRLHDFDASGWWAALNLVPLANLALYLVLLIMPGTQGANRFGDPPPPNTTGVILLASILPAVMIVGIIAAIAIPAYHSYVERARAAQHAAPAQAQ